LNDESLFGWLGLQIANMLADKHIIAHGQRDGIFQMRPHRQNGCRLGSAGYGASRGVPDAFIPQLNG